MKYTYACKKVPLNDSIKDYAEKRVEKLEKYFHRDDASAFVTFTVEKTSCAPWRSLSGMVPLSSGRRPQNRMGICAVPLMPPSAILSGRS